MILGPIEKSVFFVLIIRQNFKKEEFSCRKKWKTGPLPWQSVPPE